MKIEHNIKPMKAISPKKGKSKYQFSDMKKGDSFEVEERKRFSVGVLAKKYGDSCSPPKTFTVRRDERKRLSCFRLS